MNALTACHPHTTLFPCHPFPSDITLFGYRRSYQVIPTVANALIFTFGWSGLLYLSQFLESKKSPRYLLPLHVDAPHQIQHQNSFGREWKVLTRQGIVFDVLGWLLHAVDNSWSRLHKAKHYDWFGLIAVQQDVAWDTLSFRDPLGLILLCEQPWNNDNVCFITRSPISLLRNWYLISRFGGWS